MNWIYSSNDRLFQTLVGYVIIFVFIIILTRIGGLRAFAKRKDFQKSCTNKIGITLRCSVFLKRIHITLIKALGEDFCCFLGEEVLLPVHTKSNSTTE